LRRERNNTASDCPAQCCKNSTSAAIGTILGARKGGRGEIAEAFLENPSEVPDKAADFVSQRAQNVKIVD